MEKHELIQVMYKVKEHVNKVGYVKIGHGRPNSYVLHCKIFKLKTKVAVKEFVEAIEAMGYEKVIGGESILSKRLYLLKGNGVYVGIYKSGIGNPKSFRVCIEEVR